MCQDRAHLPQGTTRGWCSPSLPTGRCRYPPGRTHGPRAVHLPHRLACEAWRPAVAGGARGPAPVQSAIANGGVNASGADAATAAPRVKSNTIQIALQWAMGARCGGRHLEVLVVHGHALVGEVGEHVLQVAQAVPVHGNVDKAVPVQKHLRRAGGGAALRGKHNPEGTRTFSAPTISTYARM